MIVDKHILPFFEKYEKLIVGLSAIAGVIAIFLTMYQVRETKKQIKANFSYQLHKDGREIGKDISIEIYKCIISNDIKKECRGDTEKKAERKIIEMLRYYASAYNQRIYGNVDQHEWDVIEKEFSAFLGYKKVKETWIKSVQDKDSWDERFRKIGDELLKKQEEKRKKK